ncbi:MAG: hypothetical protein DRJ09_11265 [Bacteroidetes bacterium]|nr:MAG: hypothetical protein DRJ09_11265 [Bacteroidota bacterium]
MINLFMKLQLIFLLRRKGRMRAIKKTKTATVPLPYRVAVKELYLTTNPNTFPVGDYENKIP